MTAVRVVLTCDGVRIPDSVVVVSLEAQSQADRIPWARIVFAGTDVMDPERSHGRELLAHGDEVSVEAGEGDDLAVVFTGRVHRTRLLVGERGQPRVVVELKAHAAALQHPPAQRVWHDITVEELAGSLSSAAGLLIEVESHDGPRTQMDTFRSVADGWTTLLRLAALAGCFVVVDGQKVRLIKVGAAPVAELAITCSRPDLLALDVELDTASDAPSASVVAWDGQRGAVVEVRATPATPGSFAPEVARSRSLGPEVITPGMVSGGKRDGLVLAQAAAASLLTRRRARLLRGTVRLRGPQSVTPGQTVRLDDGPPRLRGRAQVTGVAHRIDGGAWRVDLQLGLSPEQTGTSPAGAEDEARLHRAVVLKPSAGQAHDPDLVPIRLLDDVDSSPEGGMLARLAQPVAGSGHGMSVRPRTHDLVVVGFLDAEPVILGSLFDARRPGSSSEEQQQDEPADFSLVTPDGSALLLLDTTREDSAGRTVSLRTRDGSTVLLTDGDEGGARIADQQGNQVVLDSSGVTLSDQSGNRVSLGAAGVSVKADKSLTLEAGTKITIKAGSVEIG